MNSNPTTSRPLWMKFADPIGLRSFASWVLGTAVLWMALMAIENYLVAIWWHNVVGALLFSITGISTYRFVALLLRWVPGYRKPA